MGPWRPTADQSLVFNPYSWTNVTNTVFLSQPVDTGFSYATASVEHDDLNSAQDNVLIVKEFLNKFPERGNNIFYIASESYGGHYIPQWTLLLFDEPEFQNTFKGFLLGNPFTGLASGDIAMALTFWGLQIVPYPTWDEFTRMGCDQFTNNYLAYSKDCWSVMNVLFDLPGDLNPYALTYPTCVNSTGGFNQARRMKQVFEKIRKAYLEFANLRRSSFEEARSKSKEDRLTSTVDADIASIKLRDASASAKGVSRKPNAAPAGADELGPERINYDPCTEDYAGLYLNAADVREALHTTQSPQPWAMCSDLVYDDWPIADFIADTTPLYTEIIKSPKRSPDFKMLIFSGDVDGICATVGTQSWIYSVIDNESTNLSSPSLNSVHSMWRPYMVSGQQAGYITQFQDALTFATVHSAGHEVPGYQPRRAFYLYQMFLNGSAFHLDSMSSSAVGTASDTGSQYLLWFSVTTVFMVAAATVVCFQSRIQGYLSPISRDYNLVDTRDTAAAMDAQDEEEEIHFNPLARNAAPEPEDIDQIRV